MWLFFTALGAPPSPARQCAEAALGSEVEVCVKLAAGHPDATNALALALKAHIDRGSSADRDLLSALLLLLGAGTELAGIDALAALDDPRALGPLFGALQSPNIPIALAAIDALSRFRSAHPQLVHWMLDPQRSIATRAAIAEGLASTGETTAADAIIDALRQRGLPLELREAMTAGIRRYHPTRIGELRREISVNGTPWSTATGALTLGYALAVTGQSSSPDLTLLAAGTGSLAGGTVGYLLGQGFPVEAGDAAFVTTSSALGTASGYALGAGLSPEDPELRLWTGLGGQLVGLSAGLLLQRTHPGNQLDSIEATVISAATRVMFAGALQVGADNGLSDPGRTDALALGAGIGLLGGGVLGHAVAPNLQLERNDWALVLLATGSGVAIGQFAPLAGNERGPLPVVGAAAGLLGGIAMSGSIDPDWDALGSGGAGAVFGGLVLGGTSLWLAPDRKELAGGAALLGGVAGMGLGGLLADVDQDPIDDRDVVLATLAAGWTGAHVLAINNRVTADPLANPGPLMVLPAMSGAIVSGLAPMLDVPITHSTAGLTLGLWGAYLGATTGAIAFDEPILYGMIGGDIGVGLGMVVLSPIVGLTPTTVALADGGGILGAATGLVATRALTRDPDALLVGSITGATAGFISGALVGRNLRRSGKTRNIALHLPNTLQWSVRPDTFANGTVLGATIGVRGW